MRNGAEFSHDGWDYQVIELPSLNRVQVWYRPPSTPADPVTGPTWSLGHGKDIPAGMSFKQVARTIELAMRGSISHADYNRVLPR